jgi:hypothetical protein
MKSLLQNLKWSELQAELNLPVGHDTPIRIDEQVSSMEDPQPSTSTQSKLSRKRKADSLLDDHYIFVH